MNTIRPQTVSGYLLMEVLIAILVLSIALLGYAALQMSAMKNSHSALMRGEAALRVAEVVDRMRANRVQVIAGQYNNGSTTGQAQQDFNAWQTAIASELIEGAGTINCTFINAIASSRCTISIQWTDNRGEGIRKGETGLGRFITYATEVLL